jgi:hypothetical protein
VFGEGIIIKNIIYNRFLSEVIMYTGKNSYSRQAIYVLCLLGLGLILQGCYGNGGGPKSIGPCSHLKNDTFLPLSKEKEPLPDCPLQPNVSQHALIVGINNYQYVGQIMNSEGDCFKNLKGAVNDAYVIAKALCHTNKVNLPKERILLDNRATLSNFQQAWEDMVKEAQPGDTLIVTFSGHGGQEPDLNGDEKDCYTNKKSECEKKDETLLFHDFFYSQGRMTDDELRVLFEKANDYKIVSVIDACHSAGMVRGGMQEQRIRTGGYFIPTKGTGGGSKVNDSSQSPIFDDLFEHITIITAIELESRKVYETIIDGKEHGALSWFFALALSGGEADNNKNGTLEREELEIFLGKYVEQHMKDDGIVQTPKILPDGDTVAVLKLGDSSESHDAHIQDSNVPDVITIMAQPDNVIHQDLKHVSVVTSKKVADLHFVVENLENKQVKVFDKYGKLITTLSSNQCHLWQRVIDKERLLKVLNRLSDGHVRITLNGHEGKKDGLLTVKMGDKAYFSVEPSDRKENLNALILFNLASTGELQFLYPLTRNNKGKEDPKVIKDFPYKLPEMRAGLPLGRDNLVAVLCKKPAKGLRTLLERNAPALPKHKEILKYLHNDTCQVEQYPIFTTK